MEEFKLKKESTGFWGCVGIVILFFLLIKFWYIIIIGLGIWAIYHYRKPIMDFYHRRPLIALVIGFFSVILLITGIAIAETPSSDTNSSKTEKVAKSSDDADEDIDESDEDDFDEDVVDSSSDNDIDDESDSSEETSSDENYDTDDASSESDTDSVTSSDADESSNEVSSSSTKEVSSIQEGDWTVAGPGMVFVSDSNLYYSRVKNPGNFQYVSQQDADSSGAHRASRGNEYARP